MERRFNASSHTLDYGHVLLNTDKKRQIEKPGTYAACEQMIQISFMVMQLGTLDQILERFEKNGRLSAREHQSLFKLARQLWDNDS
jgi:hypothetical protein